MLVPTIDLANVSLIFGSALAGFVSIWIVKKAILLIS